ncbi:hypothetical protein [Roseiconus lacunae]|uniref:Glyoxalase n=1 Tax=Roseiconus lacunae TaxID=2605694 RepID=A0ABT7PS61_9BACT|nr:hypothetical protein [Roseiconus lacunae]MDM4019342.1 hypothetical protein [Roseiconus lacunae]
MLTYASRIRPFRGAKDLRESRSFYCEIGFQEMVVSEEMSAFNLQSVWFYLQRYYVRDWVDNSMVFLEVEDLNLQRSQLIHSGIVDRYTGARVSEIQASDWGREFFLHDPSGNLWHIGSFSK